MVRWWVGGTALLLVAAAAYWILRQDSENDGRAALASIYAVTTPPCDRFPLRGWRGERPERRPEFCFRLQVMDPERAAQVIARGRRSRHGTIRWILAAKQLGARAKLEAEGSVVPSALSGALEHLGVLEIVAQILARQPDADVETLEDEITQELQEATAAFAACSPTTPEVHAETNWLGVTEMSSASTVPFAIQEAAEIADPQQWDRCTDEFEHADYVGASPPPPGSSWTGTLSEKYVVQLGGVSSAWFENDLCIATALTEDEKYTLEYDLDELGGCKGASKQSWAFGEGDPSAGGISVDQGTTTLVDAAADATASTLDIEKTLFLDEREGYDRAVIDYWTVVAMEIIGDEAPKVLCTCYQELHP